ncbi:O-antigen polymerase [Acinetobacter sp. YH12100]|uniref:O-antigen polymerase n=1 Tax=Acinetobacter sp. YH12100 TaxID=2601089 RepID=UPI0015D2C8E2|nr:O-antigen polymerase [Acinetobacter sp. YH12100]
MEYIYLGFFITFFFLFFILTSGKVDYFSPLSLHVVSWFFIFFVGLFVGNQFYPLTNDIFYSFIIWFFTLTFSFLLMYFYQGKLKRKDYKYELKYQKIYIVLSIFACVILAGEVFYVGMGGPYHFFLNLRLSLTLEEYEGVKYTFGPYFYLLMTPLFAISLMCHNTSSLKKVTTLWQIIFIISSAGKLAILTMLMIFLVTKYAGTRKKISVILLSIIMTIFLTFSFFMHAIRQSDVNNSLSMIDMVGGYAFPQLIAIGELQVGDGVWGEYTFRFFYAVAYKLGLSNHMPVETILEYAYIPTPTNVYTVIQPFFQDFGNFGVFFGALFYSFFYSILYFQVVSKRGVYLVIYSLLSLSLVFSFFSETLIINLSLNLYLILFSIIVWRSSVVKH